MSGPCPPASGISPICVRRGWVNKWPATFRGVVIGQDQLELWARGLETFPAAIPSNYGARGVGAFSAAGQTRSGAVFRCPV